MYVLYQMKIITPHITSAKPFTDNYLALPGSLARRFPEGRLLLPPR